MKFITDANTDPHVRLEAVAALGGLHDPSHRRHADRPARRSGADDPRSRRCDRSRRSIATTSSPSCRASIPIRTGRVRAALATVLGSLPPGTGLARVNQMLGDDDQRVIPSVLAALVALHDPACGRHPARSSEGRRSGGARRGRRWHRRAEAAARRRRRSPTRIKAGQRDAMYSARAAALAAIVKYGAADATPLLKTRARRQGLGRPRPRRDAAESSSTRRAPRTSTRRFVRRRRRLPADDYTAPRVWRVRRYRRRCISTPTAARSRSSSPCSTRR